MTTVSHSPLPRKPTRMTVSHS
uniref:Uncharacterized protein n=1 Tax=Arundo donax TaxID=35708 RepID=A0A0A8YB13_ARUDO